MFRKWIAFLLLAGPLFSGAQNIDALILNKKYSEALTAIHKSLSEKASGDLYFKQASVYRILNKPLSAERALINCIESDSANCTYLSEYADLQLELGNPYKAKDYYRKASEICTSDMNLKFKLCQSYYNLEDYKNAFNLAQIIYANDSINLAYQKLFGLTAQKMGKTELAINLFEAVLARNPLDFNSYMNLISQYLIAKNAVGIVRTADRGQYFFPGNSALRAREANSLYVLKEYVEAIPPYEFYLSKNDSVFGIMKNYGISKYYNNDYEKAIKILENCCQQVVDDEIVYFYLGLAYKNLPNYSRSADCLIAAISCAQPVYMTEMYHHLGQVYGQKRDFEKSIEALKKAYDYNKERHELLFEIATTYEEFSPDKTNASNYYNQYLKVAGDKAEYAAYAMERLKLISEWVTRKK